MFKNASKSQEEQTTCGYCNAVKSGQCGKAGPVLAFENMSDITSDMSWAFIWKPTAQRPSVSLSVMGSLTSAAAPCLFVSFSRYDP